MTAELQRALEQMETQYQEIRRARSAGELSREEARLRVLSLAHRDGSGRTWQIDLHNSDRTAVVAITADDAMADDAGIAQLRDRYETLVRAFESGATSSEETRQRVKELSYVDAQGRRWQIDITRAGHSAALMVSEHRDASAAAGLDLLAGQYTAIVGDFETGRITADDARRQVRDLAYTDPTGRTWRIDTQRSGRTAQFAVAHHATTPVPAMTTGEVPVVGGGAPSHPARVEALHRRHRRHRRAAWRVAGWSVAASTLVVPLAWVTLSHLDGGSPEAGTSVTDPTSPAGPSGSAPGTADGPAVTDSSTVTTETPADLPTTAGLTAEQVPFETAMQFGTSVQGRSLVVKRRGSSDGARVLVVGVIHGNEQAGLPIHDLLDKMELGGNIDLWLVRSMNPDGVVANIRQNANGVDLNRNFSVNWAEIGLRGYWQYSGPSAASEPETKAMMALARMIEPDVVIWYHQDYFRIEPKSGREGQIRARYAGLVDLPLLPISGGSYSGTANGWVRTVLAPRGMSMTVEIGPELREGEAEAHANAVLTIVAEYWSGDEVPLSNLP